MSIDGGKICHDCWRQFDFIGDNFCKKCGHVFEFDIEDEECLGCVKNKYYFNRMIFCCKYNPTSSSMILRIKNSQHIFMSKFIAFLCVKKMQNYFSSDTRFVITGIPMTFPDLLKRGINQSMYIARLIGLEFENIEFKHDVLKKIRQTKKQASLTKTQREKNLKNAFCVKNLSKHDSINLILFDDVCTTSSTLNECARTIKKYNKNIDITCVTFAKV